LAPPADNPICPGVRTVDDAAVIDWDVDHPAVGGLQGLEALTLEHAVQLVTPGWGSAVVLGATARGAFPLLVAGERDGRRVACLGGHRRHRPARARPVALPRGHGAARPRVERVAAAAAEGGRVTLPFGAGALGVAYPAALAALAALPLFFVRASRFRLAAACR